MVIIFDQKEFEIIVAEIIAQGYYFRKYGKWGFDLYYVRGIDIPNPIQQPKGVQV